MQLSGATLCALCLGAHDRRFTRLQSDSGSQAKPSSAEEQASLRSMAYHVIHGSDVTSNIIPYAE